MAVVSDDLEWLALHISRLIELNVAVWVWMVPL